jgi:MFS family permease
MSAVLSVLFTREAFPVAFSSLIARLPKGITPFATVTLIAETNGSYALAGAVAAASAFGDALATPAQGRLLDRHGRGRVLVPSAVLYAVALAALPVLAAHHVPVAVLFGCALLVGVGFPPISGSMKALWPRLVADGAAPGPAYAAESLIQQVLLLIAPLLTAALIFLAGSGAALWTAAGATLSGTVAFVVFAARTGDRPTREAHRGGGALRVRAVRIVVVATLVQGVIFGAMPVVLPGLAAAAGSSKAVGGLLLAAWILGGITGSLRRSDATFPVALARLSAALAVPAAVAAATGGALVPVAVAFCAAGLFLTPIAAASYLLVDRAAPAGRRTEAFAWLSTALAIGGSAGSALAGVTVEHLGAVPAVLLPMLAAGSATAVAARLRVTSDR